MSIQSQIKKVKQEVTCYGFWRKTSTATTKESVSKYILSYVDETSKADALAESRKQSYGDVQFGKPNPVEQGIGYLSKEEQGRIRVFGFLRDDVEKLTGMPPNHLSNDARVMACHRAWMGRLEQHPGVKKYAHKFVLSLDPRFCELMARGGKDSDALLIQGVRTVLRRFQEKYYPGDRLGYLVGVHHDRQHIHAHVLLLPWAESGRHLKVTDSEEDKRYRDLRKVADKFVKDYFYKEFEAPLKATDRPVDKVMQERVVAYAAYQSFFSKTLPETEPHAWVAAEKQRLQDLPEDELRGILGQWHVRIGNLYGQLAKQLAGNAEATKASVRIMGAQQVKLKEKLQQNEAHLLDIKARQTALMGELNSAQKGIGNFRFFAAGASGKGLSVFEGATPEQRKWLTDLCSDPDLADTARAALRSTERETRVYHIIDGMKMSGQLRRVLAGPKGAAGAAEADQRLFAKNGRDLLRNAMLVQIEELRAKRELLKAELKAAHAQRDGIRIGLDTVKVRETLLHAALKGRKPFFLEQYEGLQRAGIDIPVLARRQLSQDLVPGHQTDRAVRSFEDLNRKIINTLNAFKGSTSTEDVFQVDTYFRAVTDATAGSQKQLAKREAAEAALLKKLATKSIEEYLLEQNTSPAASIPERTKRINRSPDFDI